MPEQYIWGVFPSIFSLYYTIWYKQLIFQAFICLALIFVCQMWRKQIVYNEKKVIFLSSLSVVCSYCRGLQNIKARPRAVRYIQIEFHTFPFMLCCDLVPIMHQLNNCSMLIWLVFIKDFVCLFQANFLSIMLKTNSYSTRLRWSSPNLLFQPSWWVWSTNMRVILLQTMKYHVMFLIKSGNRKENK